MRYLALLFTLLLAPLFSDIIEKEGKGFLETKENQLILHLKGTPYEMGLQQGKLLKEKIQWNISKFVDAEKPSAFQKRQKDFVNSIPLLLKHVPSSFQEEMKGIADGSGIPLQKIIALNLFPEMFHCSAITATNDATSDKSLYHVRVLEYAVGKSLQNTAVLMVVEPEGKNAFINVSYAGFIGSVTGMNDKKISMGEIGGLGYGSWDGVPMAFLIRQVLENATTLDEAKKILSDAKRTCEYYYIIGDGNTNTSAAVYATSSQIQFITPGSTYALLSPKTSKNPTEDDKIVLSSCALQNNAYQMILSEDKKTIGLVLEQPKECLLLTGFPSPERYPVLAERISQKWGNIDTQDLIEIIKGPASKVSNLHNAIFKPSTLTLWISHAGPNDEPAYDMPYFSFSLADLLTEAP